MELRAAVKILEEKYKIGDVVKVKLMIIHKMDTGFGVDKESGKKFPRFYMKEINALYNGKPVAHFELDVAASQNPVIQFALKITAPGELVVDFINSENDTAQKKLVIAPTI